MSRLILKCQVSYQTWNQIPVLLTQYVFDVIMIRFSNDMQKLRRELKSSSLYKSEYVVIGLTFRRTSKNGVTL